MSYSLPDGSTLHLATVFGAVKKITAISNAADAVATCTGHGLTTGDYIVLSAGWGKLDNRVFKVEISGADAFKILGADTSDASQYPATANTGSFRKITQWEQIRQVVSFSFTGGDQQYATFSFLEEDFERQLPTVRSASSITITIADDPAMPGYQAAKAASDKRVSTPLRMDLKNGSQIVYQGIVSLNEVPTVEKGQLMQVNISYSLQGVPNRY